MRTIEKGQEPPSLKRHRKSGGTYDNYAETDDLRSALLKDQGHICCYCMRRITARDMKNEHWASQTEHEQKTVDWHNLMGSCKGGDGERGAIKHCDSYSKTKPMRIEEFEPERKWWKKRKETDQAWKVSIEDIKARGYNLDIKNPRAADDGPGDADALLKEYLLAAAEAENVRDMLRDELRAAIEGGKA